LASDEKPVDESKPNSDRFRELSHDWLMESIRIKYSYRFTWMGRPIIQYPQDVMAMQELLWRVRPDTVVECGIAYGGSLVFYASMLKHISPHAKVIGIDVEIRLQNRAAIEAHPMSECIELVEGSSVDPAVVAQVHAGCAGARRVVVALDSNHTAAHVLAEMRSYAPLVGVGSYLVVFDTVIDDIPRESLGARPWGRGNSPRTAVDEFLRTEPAFEADPELGERYVITGAPGGFLRRKA
jgi:cephalosporin hydroxylase